MPPEDDDPTVKEMLDAATRADLERWFSLPSFQEVAEQPPAPGDPELAAVLERREKALAAVDPALLERIRVRTEQHPETVLAFDYSIDVQLDEQFGVLDQRMLARVGSVAEPREVELPDELVEDLNECTPQALLRDLHRPELDFEKTFEVVDVAAEQRVDIVAEVRAAMTASRTLPDLGASPLAECRRELAALRAERRRPWIEYLPLLANRSVRE